ncbi:DEAD/DEAH box helicase, partial [Candidatus Bathyarchaeota archaeon]|nr:DEAD/DEAH box helicase [Desulfobacterales bacterium]NIV68210.1 DEAD/DEAH box helicase [Candidatus Bathyarchaeota archaeon]NIW34740.1 DEAD/DEAH box helicase [Candidatus Bathyarchaeota archaeon]
FLSPLKAVTKEKFNDWSNPNHGWSGRKLSIVTGDYRLTKKRQRELKEADVIPMTSECLDSITRSTYNEKHVWLLETGVLVVDEAHLITMEGRGDRLESALIRFTSQNPDCRVVLLSATMPNVGQLAGWLKALNGKRTVVIESDWRPCTLETHIKEYPSEAGWGAYYRNEKEKLEAARDIVVEYPKDKFLCFTHSKTNCRNLHEMLRDEGIK